MAPVLGYWQIRGLGQPIRLLLEYTETEYEDLKYSDAAKWFDDDKKNLGLAVPNLPYYIDGNFKISQSLSIVRYLGKKHGLAGNTDEDAATADMFSQDLYDLRVSLSMAAYDPDFIGKKPGHLETLKAKLTLYEAVLEKNKWFLGDNLSYVDFVAYEFFDCDRLLDAESFTNFPKVRCFLKRFEELPQIKKYMQSDRFMRWPVNSSIATWGGKLEESPFK